MASSKVIAGATVEIGYREHSAQALALSSGDAIGPGPRDDYQSAAPIAPPCSASASPRYP
jgi:hypothetical protein